MRTKTSTPRSQRGLTLILMLTILTLGTTYVLVQQMNALSQRLGQDRATTDVLAQAKQALIGYAAQYPGRPGALPCPDNDNNGWADDQQVPNTDCNQADERVGRLPWKTLGLPDLRDSAGERLWYALSDSLRDKGVVNSNSEGQLSVRNGLTDAITDSKVVALIIAPGAPLSGQTRGLANENTAAMYLEWRNSDAQSVDPQNVDFVQPHPTAKYPRGSCLAAAGQEIECNDRLLLVTHQDLFSVVESMVASKIERGIKPYVVTYFNQWSNAFPFPAKFANPHPGTSATRTQSQYIGDTTTVNEGGGTGRGLLPITASDTYSLMPGSSSVTLTGGTADSISGVSCTTIASSPTSGFECIFTINALNSPAVCGVPTVHCMVNPSFTVSGDIADVGISFAKMADSDVTVTSSSGVTQRTMSAITLTRTLSSAGVASVTFQGTHSYSSYRASMFTRSMKVSFPVVASALTSATDANAGWFIKNEWYRLTYYVVSPGHLPGGSGSCTALPGTPSCLTVNNMPSSYALPNTNKRALLTLAGRSLNASTRPSSNLANYLERENATPADFILEHRVGTTPSINDRVVVVSP